MRSLDVFSCIGCHAIGFERAGIETVALCEVNPWRRDRLKERWPGVPIYDDIKTIASPSADIIFGGPPCHRVTPAAAPYGKQTGETLWPYMLRAGINAGAKWFVVEQPPGNAEWEDAVCRDLAGNGYHASRIEFAACDVGAPYQRRRVYILACTCLARLEVAWSSVPIQIKRTERSATSRAAWCPDQLATLPVVAVDAGEMDRGPKSRERKEWILALGDSNPPEMAEVLGRAIMSTMEE